MKASFPDPEPRLATLLAAVRDCSKWGLFTRPLTHDWGRGRIQLIGDAAHAMLPNAGQGACQAFEDAYILSRWLDAEVDPVDAFERFREVRIPRVHAVQTRAAANARMFHMKDADARNQQLKSAEVKGGAINWIYDFDPVKEWNRIPEPQSVG
jgi:salicylate hydroxylase